MKNILITTDFTKDSRYSLQYMLELLKDVQSPCKILLVNTYMVQHTDPSKIIMLNDELKSKSKDGLEKQRSETLKLITNPNISIEVASHMGSLRNVIHQLLDSTKFDLVVMGKNGGKHVESVSTLLKQKHCPLLITHADVVYDQVV